MYSLFNDIPQEGEGGQASVVKPTKTLHCHLRPKTSNEQLYVLVLSYLETNILTWWSLTGLNKCKVHYMCKR